MRAVFRFGKRGRLRFVSHLDLQRYMQRALNRTELPVAFSQGFNPHPIMSFASALAMGWESEYEVLDIKLTEPVSTQKAIENMRSALPEEMPIYDVRLVEDNHPSMMSLVKMSDYRIIPKENFELLKAGAREFLFQESVMAIRKTKSSEREIDIRPLCISLSCDESALTARLMLTEQDTLKPDVLLGAVSKLAGIEPPQVRIDRKQLLGVTKAGKLLPLMEL